MAGSVTDFGRQVSDPLSLQREAEMARTAVGGQPRSVADFGRRVTDPREIQFARSTMPSYGAPGQEQALEPPDTDMDSYLEKMGKIFAHDFASLFPSMMTSAGGLESYLEKATGLGDGSGNFLTRGGKNAQEWLDETLRVEHPDMFLRIIGGLGSAASFLVPGLGVAGGTTRALTALRALGTYGPLTARAAKTYKLVSRLFGAASSAALESAVEAADKQSRLMADGASPADAYAESSKVFWANLVPIMATDLPYFSGLGRLSKLAVGAVSEGAQEAYQTAVQHWADGKSLAEIASDPLILKDMRDSAIIGAATGGIVGAVMPTDRGPLPDEVKPGALDQAPGVDFKKPGTMSWDTIAPWLRNWMETPEGGKDKSAWSKDWMAAIYSVAQYADNGALRSVLAGWRAAATAENTQSLDPSFMEFGNAIWDELGRRGEKLAAQDSPQAISMYHRLQSMTDEEVVQAWQDARGRLRKGVPEEGQGAFAVAVGLIKDEMGRRAIGGVIPTAMPEGPTGAQLQEGVPGTPGQNARPDLAYPPGLWDKGKMAGVIQGPQGPGPVASPPAVIPMGGGWPSAGMPPAGVLPGSPMGAPPGTPQIPATVGPHPAASSPYGRTVGQAIKDRMPPTDPLITPPPVAPKPSKPGKPVAPAAGQPATTATGAPAPTLPIGKPVGPGAVKGSTYTGPDFATRKLFEKTDDEVMRKWNSKVAGSRYVAELSHLNTFDRKLTEILSRATGVRVLFVKFGARSGVDGVRGELGGETVLLVSEGSETPVLSVFLHEFTHFLQISYPDIYRRLAKYGYEAQANSRGATRWVNLYKKSYGPWKIASLNAVVPGRDVLNEEVVAELSAAMAPSREFWEALAQENPSAFQEISRKALEIIRALVQKFMNAVTLGSFGDQRTWLRDMSSFRDDLVGVIREVAEQNGQYEIMQESDELVARLSLTRTKDEELMPVGASDEIKEWIGRERAERDIASPQNNMGSIIYRWRTRFVDDLALFEKRVKDAFGELPINLDPVKIARLARGYAVRAVDFINNGPRGFYTGAKIPGVRGLRDIIRDKKYQITTHWVEWNYYLLAKRIVAMGKDSDSSLYARAFKTDGGALDMEALAELDKARKIVETYEQRFPEWNEGAKEVKAYADALLDYMVQARMYTQDEADEMKRIYDDWVPLEELDLIDKESSRTGPASGRARSPIRSMGRLSGNTAYVMPMASMVRRTFQVVRLANDNYVKQLLGNLVNEGGTGEVTDPRGERQPQVAWMLKSPKMRPVFKRAGELMRAALSAQETGDTTRKVAKQLRAEFGDQLDGWEIERIMEITHLDPVSFEAMAKMMVVSENQGRDVVAYLEDGEVKYMRVNRDIYDALTKMNHDQVAETLKHISWTTKILRAGATWNPEFAIRNPFRDMVAASIQARYLVNWQRGPVHGINDMAMLIPRMIRGLAHAAKRDGTYQDWINAYGGMAEHVATDITDIEKKTLDMVKQETRRGKTIYIVKHPLLALQMFSSMTEQASRIAVYKKSLDEIVATGKYTEHQARLMAGLESREASLDFNKMGSQIPPLNMLVAFLNAQIRGYDKMISTFKNPATRMNAAINATVMVTLPSLILWMINKDEEWYKERPRWEKNMFWIASPDGGQTRFYFPKPFELGLLFGSLFERMGDQLSGNDQKALQDWLYRFTLGSVPTNVLPMLSAGVETVANYSFFRKERIVPDYITQLPNPLQYNSRTSETAKTIGRITNLSPMMIDHWVRGSFAGLGVHAKNVVDYVMLAAQGKLRSDFRAKGDPARHTMEDVIIAKAFMRSEPAVNTRYVDDFYSLYEQSVGAKTAVTMALRGRTPPKEIAWIFRNHMFALVTHDMLNSVAVEAGKITAAIRVVESENYDVSPEQKRDELDNLYKLRNQLFKATVAQVEQMRANPETWDKLSRESSQRMQKYLDERRGG